MHLDRDPTAVVTNLDAAVLKDLHVDFRRVSSHRLVNGVVDYLPDEVVQTTFSGGADIHARTFADGLQTFENGDGVGAVSLLGLLLRSSHGWKRLLGGRSDGSDYRRQVMRAVYREIAPGLILRRRFCTPICAVCGMSRSAVREDA